MDQFLSYSFPISLAFMPVMIGSFICYIFRKRQDARVGRWVRFLVFASCVGFIAPILSGFFVGHKLTTKARMEIAHFLQQPNLVIERDGEEVDNPASYLAEFRKLKHMPAHHSHPISSTRTEFNVSSAGESLVLIVEQDSSDPREFWVFYPKYRFTRFNEVGRIISDLF